ncbi:AraC family transcriptional regulator [Lactobacillus sp. ESL0679]|uniref:AraC family transcriptional regulator n=1 Tax=Lactobacillus sp. ESL0679 TaxID=2983209 RepID=UPI0023F706AE|nr:AraC family transcriptional regulator [Lactobacillus sp. ESL0679]MDF7682978.1 AraC family transcriptional regulator [Lactobacillus sp. ESL0679]
MEQSKHEIIKFKQGLPFKIFTFHGKNSNKKIPLHWHEQIELLFCIEGHLSVSISNNQYLMTPNDIIYIRSNQLHSTFSPSPNHVLCIQIPMKWLRYNLGENFATDWDISINTVHDELISDKLLIQKLIYVTSLLESKNKDLSTNLKIKGEIFLVLDSLIKHITKLDKETTSTANTELKIEMLNYVKNNFQTQISLDSLSQHFGYSSEYCSRMFKRLIGTNFKELLTSYRLSNAYDQLINSNDSIESIAAESGFVSYRTMYNTFLKYYNMTPSQLKLLYQNNEINIKNNHLKN